MTVAPPTWSILVPTLGERWPSFESLMSTLLPQAARHGNRVQVVGWHNNGSPSLPKIRQTMVRSAKTDYVSFFDDDDVPAPYFVDEVMAALETRPDYVGFQVQCYSNGKPIAVAYHSLAHRRWRNMPGRFERDLSHINPIRAALARQADFSLTRTGGAEDRGWADQLRRSKVVKTEVVIPRIVYHYLHTTPDRPGGSRWKNPGQINAVSKRSTIDHPNFTWSPDA